MKSFVKLTDNAWKTSHTEQNWKHEMKRRLSVLPYYPYIYAIVDDNPC